VGGIEMLGNAGTVLGIFAHPDDEVLGVGGTIAKYAQWGASVYIVLMSEGATSRYEKEMIARLKKSALKASMQRLFTKRPSNYKLEGRKNR
jgi:LmbE family N-acetylglucosaminyl deacetylase